MTMNTVNILAVNLIFVFLASAYGGTITFNQTQEATGRIIHGSNATRHEFPYQVSYQINKEHQCGGSILTKKWVVTAAHCLIGFVGNKRVVAGMLRLGENHSDVQIVKVARQIRHPYYIGGIAPHDIGLVELSSRLKWTKAVQPIKLPRRNQEFNGYVWMSGWGFVNQTQLDPPEIMQKMQMWILTYYECAYALYKVTNDYSKLDKNTMMCVGGMKTGCESLCEGDSGGPLEQNGVLLGVASWYLMPCGLFEAPSMFTKVSKHLQFIRKYVHNV